MKYLYFILLCFIMASCSLDKEPDITQVESDTSCDFVPYDDSTIQQLDNFLFKLDSLNNEYNDFSTRGAKDALVTVAADEAGAYVGSMLGRWLGSAIGAAAANPAIAVIGHYAGQYVGKVVGSYAASAAAGSALRKKSKDSWKISALRADFNIKFDDSKADSIGYKHNKIMYNVANNYTNFMVNGEISLWDIYMAVIVNMEINGIQIPDPLKKDQLVISAILTKINKIVEIVLSESTSTNYLFYDFSSLLENECFASSSELSLFNNASRQIAEKCSNLSEAQIHSYSFELNNLIHTTLVDPTLKSSISESAQTIINSSLCWIEYRYDFDGI